MTKAELRDEYRKKREETMRRKKERKRRAMLTGQPYVSSDEDDSNEAGTTGKLTENAIVHSFAKHLVRRNRQKKTKRQLEQEAFKDQFVKDLHDTFDDDDDDETKEEHDHGVFSIPNASGDSDTANSDYDHGDMQMQASTV